MPKSYEDYIHYTPELVADLKRLVEGLPRAEGVRVLGEKMGLSPRQSRRIYSKYISPKAAVVKEIVEVVNPPRKIRRLFLDIETSPNIGLFWRVGYKLNIPHDNVLKERAIICIAWKWAGEKEVHILHWDKDQSDKKMLEQFSKVIEEADEVVGQNHSRFDLPWIRARCLFHGLRPWPMVKEIDTLKWARSKFYFNSNKLDYVAKLLGLEGKMKTEFGLWKEVLINNCAKSLAYMCEYCMSDIDLLEAVYNRLAEWMPAKTHVGMMGGGPRWSNPHTGSLRVQSKGFQYSVKGVAGYRLKDIDTHVSWNVSQKVYEEFLNRNKPGA